MTELTKRTRSAIDAVTDTDAETLRAVNLTALVERKVAKVRNTYEPISVTTDTDAEFWVQSDDLVTEVVENILLNAVVHNDTGAPEIGVSISSGDSVVTLRITDNGPGIPDTLKETVFERDMTTDAGDTLGFGLYFA
ncbi:ATP-binding protein [Haladaptatus sp. NG-WS-4]